MHLRRVFLWTMIVSLSIAAAMGIAAVLVPRFGRTQERILITSLLVGIYSLPALACAILIGRRFLVKFMWGGLVSTLVALALWLALIWLDRWIPSRPPYDLEEFIAKVGVMFTAYSVVAMHAGLLMLLRLDKPGFRLVRALTITSTAILASVTTMVFWLELFEDGIGRLMAVLTILSVCGTIVTPVLALIQIVQRRGDRESVPANVKIDLICPRCGHRQMLPAGLASCVQCHLRINIDVEEPRCECGYLLYRLQGDTCPECGRRVPVPAFATPVSSQPSTQDERNISQITTNSGSNTGSV